MVMSLKTTILVAGQKTGSPFNGQDARYSHFEYERHFETKLFNAVRETFFAV
jgi:hypothetical protein